MNNVETLSTVLIAASLILCGWFLRAAYDVQQMTEEYRLGIRESYDRGYSSGFEQCRNRSYDTGFDEGYDRGYDDGFGVAMEHING